MTNDIELSIVLPTYNERDNIIMLLQELEKILSVRYEAIVVDDDSPDKTWQAVETFASTHQHVVLIRRMNERGLTSALNTGLKAACGRLLMWMDVDLSMPPEKIPELLQAIEQGADVAVGSRYVPGGGDARSTSFLLITQLWLSKVLSILAGWVLGCRFYDWSSGFIVLKREFIEDHQLNGDYGEYFIALMVFLIRQRKAKVVEVPYTLVPRIRGESKTATSLWGFVRRGRKYLTMILRQRFVC